MGLREVKKELSRMDKIEIINMISEMYKKIEPAKNYLDILVSGEIKPIMTRYKEEIERFIYPSGSDLVLQEAEARKLIRSVRKMKISELNIELELHYVHCCLEIILDYGYWDENYYMAIEKMFYSAVSEISKIDNKKKYNKRLASISDQASKFGIELYY